MSKIIYVVTRKNDVDQEVVRRVTHICNFLNPDNIIPIPPKIKYDKNIIFGISNPSETVLVQGLSVLFGQTFGEKKNWHLLDELAPDGNFSIFRADENRIEILSDVLGTKAIWHFKNEDYFVASSSQRAIIQFLGKFEFNDNTIPWFTCNGLLGPDQGWDKNINRMAPDSSLVLEFDTWSTSCKLNEVLFKQNLNSDIQNKELFYKTMNSLFNEISLDYSKWKLSLSGGYDSRGILFSLPRIDSSGKKLGAVTWGLAKSQNLKGNDANIAREISEKLKLPFNYFSTDTSSEESLEKIIGRFLKNGEGRIDHIGGYMDGFKIWKRIFESGIKGIIRGDEVFGSYNFISEYHMKKFMGLSVPSDYDNLKNISSLKKRNFKIPDKYLRKSGETFETWRDRLYHSYLVPTFLSALEDLKQPYVEQINPLLSRKIVHLVRELPDHLRTEKNIFKKYVDCFEPNFKYANSPAIEPMQNIFRKKEIVDLVKMELESKYAESLFPNDLLALVLSKLQISSKDKPGDKFLLKIKRLVPKKIKKYLLVKTGKQSIDLNLVGFRLFLICRMKKQLEVDSQKF